MPIPMNVNKKSNAHDIDEAIGRCISFLRKEGREPDVAAGICYSEARKKTGKRLGKKK